MNGIKVTPIVPEELVIANRTGTNPNSLRHNFENNALFDALESVPETELAWCAGFFDGEGCTHVSRGSPTRALSLHVTVSQKTTPCLERFNRAMGGVGHIYQPPSGKVCQLVFSSWRKSQVTLSLMWPYLSDTKRNQATEAFERFRTDTRRKRTNPLTTWTETSCPLGHTDIRYQSKKNGIVQKICRTCDREYHRAYYLTWGHTLKAERTHAATAGQSIPAGPS